MDSVMSREQNLLEEYYKSPIIDSWTYVGMGMDNLKEHDPDEYNKIGEKRFSLAAEENERIEYIKEVGERLNLDWPQMKSCIEQFLQKFPLALRKDIGWDDPGFIFLYILAKITKPKVIIETGSNIGFSSSFIALAVKENNNNCKFYTIEPYSEYAWETLSFVEHNSIRKQEINYSKLTGKCGPLSIVPEDLRKHIILKKGYAEDILPGLLEENESVDIFFHDSDHSYKNMVWECASALPHIRTGGYILVHDIFLNSSFKEMFAKKGGLAVKEFLGIYKKTEGDINFSIKKDWSLPPDNSLLNDKEYESGNTKLRSSPKNIVIETGGACNSNCIFCPGHKNDKGRGCENFYQRLEGRLSQYISQAQKLTFKTCTSFLNSSEINEMINCRINCIELSFPEIEKVYFSNGFDLTPDVSDFIVHSPGILSRKYTVKNTVNIFLLASNSRTYKALTRTDNFPRILGQIEYFIKLRKGNDNPRVHLSFLATTLNIEDMPDFVRLAHNIGADKVACSYSPVYGPAQKYLSCFFKQEKANEVIDKTGHLAKKLKMEVDLPPKFNQKEYPHPVPCRKAWEEMTLDANGNILTCDRGEACGENLMENDFMDVWNGPYYEHLRAGLLEDSRCLKYCFKANPDSVNDFRSHVIIRGKEKSEIDISWADNF